MRVAPTQNGREAGFVPQVAQGAATAPQKKKWKLPKLGHIDIPYLAIVLLLLMFGLVMLFSASYPRGYLQRGDSYAFIGDQVKFAFIGLSGMVVASLVDYRILKKFAWPLAVVALTLLVVVLFVADKNNAHRWIWLNGAQTRGFQPSEIAKFALIMVFAKMISANQSRIKTFKYGVVPFMLVLGMMSILLILEPHISCTLLVLGIGFIMMYAGGTPIRWLMGILLLGVAAIFLAITQFPELVPSHALERFQIWRDPLNVPASKSYQTVQSLIAVGSGGWKGVGIGKSVQKFLYLPEVYNDYIFAVLCEELGMVGAIGMMVMFLALLARGLFIAVRAKDKFGSMLVLGITVQIALQAFLHVAVNLNAIPSTGISLPFFSYGGTSLCMLLGQVGVVLSVSRKANLAIGQKAQQQQEELRAAQATA
ncbi:putative lipid II flippase FtsW [Ruminococcaceae bacterium OttesenSCG-928-O06]|nr:putative lipid II flippase FtsW [Ruminococcaceae bacterium OttesenSCG-928-O06]